MVNRYLIQIILAILSILFILIGIYTSNKVISGLFINLAASAIFTIIVITFINRALEKQRRKEKEILDKVIYKQILVIFESFLEKILYIYNFPPHLPVNVEMKIGDEITDIWHKSILKNYKVGLSKHFFDSEKTNNLTYIKGITKAIKEYEIDTNNILSISGDKLDNDILKEIIELNENFLRLNKIIRFIEEGHRISNEAYGSALANSTYYITEKGITIYKIISKQIKDYHAINF